MLGSLVMAQMDEALYEGMDDAATQGHGALERTEVLKALWHQMILCPMAQWRRMVAPVCNAVALCNEIPCPTARRRFLILKCKINELAPPFLDLTSTRIDFAIDFEFAFAFWY